FSASAAAPSRAPQDDPSHLVVARLRDHRDHRSLRPRLAHESLDLALAALELTRVAVLELEDEAHEIAEVVVDEALDLAGQAVLQMRARGLVAARTVRQPVVPVL